MNQDRNLLFGVFAVQLRKVTPSQIMSAAGAWAIDPSIDLSDRLLKDHAMTPGDRELIRRLVDEAIDAHDGDAGKTLDSFGGAQQVYASLHGTVVLDGDSWISSGIKADARQVDIEEEIAIREIPGRYEEIAERGRGGMGRVLLVHDTALGRDIVLKELLRPPARPAATPAHTPPDRPLSVSSPAASPALMARFLQEARITGQLEHPNITPVYELGIRPDGRPYYTMKQVRGITLAQALRAAKNLSDRLALLPHFGDLCQAVAYAHSKGVIHRDLKPDNIMIGEFGETVVLDWGLAKIQGKPDAHLEASDETVRLWRMGDDADSGLTDADEILGTPLYMAPEQAKAQHEFIDHRTDIYALGAILYHILAGRPQFEWTSKHEVMARVANEPPEPIGYLERNAPRALIAICERAMQKHRANRYQNTKQLAADITRFQSGQLVEAYSYSAGELTGHFVRRYRTLATSLAIALILVVGFSTFIVANLRAQNQSQRVLNQRLAAEQRSSERARSTASSALRNEQDRRDEVEWKQYVSHIRDAQRAINEGDMLSARRRLQEAPAQFRNWEWGYLASQLDQSNRTSNIGGGWLAPRFAPRSNEITHALPREFLIYEPDGHTPRFRLDFGNNEPLRKLNLPLIQAYAMSPQGDTVVIGHAGGELSAWRTTQETTSPRNLYVPDQATGRDILTLAYTHDGTRLLAGLREPYVDVHGAENLAFLRRVDIGASGIEYIATHPTKPWFCVSTEDGTIAMWDLKQDTAIWTERAHDGSFQTMPIALSPNGELLALQRPGAVVGAIWDANTGKPIRDLRGPDNAARTISFDPSGRYLLTASNRGPTLWSAETGAILHLFRAHISQVISAEFNFDGTKILSRAFDTVSTVSAPATKLWDVDLDRFALNTRLDSFVQAAAISIDGAYAVSSGSDRIVRVLDLANDMTEVWTSAPFDSQVVVVSINRNGNRVLALARDEGIELWDVENSVRLYSGPGISPDYGDAGSFNGQGTLAVVPTSDGSALMLDAVTGDKLFETANEGFGGARFANEGDRIVAWAATHGRMFQPYRNHAESTRFDLLGPICASFDHAGRYIVVGDELGGVTLIDAMSPSANIRTFDPHADKVLQVSFSPDDSRVATASKDGTVRIWDPESLDELLELRESYGNLAQAAQFHPANQSLITAGSNVKFRYPLPWNAETWRQLRLSVDIYEMMRLAPKTTKVIVIDSESLGPDPQSRLNALRERINAAIDARHLWNIAGQGVLVVGEEYEDKWTLQMGENFAMAPMDLIRPPLYPDDPSIDEIEKLQRFLEEVTTDSFRLTVSNYCFTVEYELRFGED